MSASARNLRCCSLTPRDIPWPKDLGEAVFSFPYKLDSALQVLFLPEKTVKLVRYITFLKYVAVIY